MSTNLSKLPATAAEWLKETLDGDVDDMSIFDLYATTLLQLLSPASK
jgi:hypothetical protein